MHSLYTYTSMACQAFTLCHLLQQMTMLMCLEHASDTQCRSKQQNMHS